MPENPSSTARGSTAETGPEKRCCAWPALSRLRATRTDVGLKRPIKPYVNLLGSQIAKLRGGSWIALGGELISGYVGYHP